MFCIAAMRASALRGKVLLFARICFIFRRMAEGGGDAAGGCRLQGVATGKQNMAAALSLAIKHTEQNTELHKLANSSQIA